MTLSAFLLGYVVLLLLSLSVVAVYEEVRRRRFEPGPNQDAVFRCEGCGSVYTDDADADRSRCPHCGITNEPYSF